MINNNLKLKICGMRDAENVSDVAGLLPDYMGFIFYLKSSRFVGDLAKNIIQYVKKQGIHPVAVFVDMAVDSVLQIAEYYGFTHIQLHGKETPQTCRTYKEKGLKVLKAFSIADSSDLEIVQSYENCCDYFLFDTKTSIPGGSGCHFDWNILKNYTGTTPFFLSGGIGLDDVSNICDFEHPMLFGIDVNSCFEIQPALKDVELLKKFTEQLNFKK